MANFKNILEGYRVSFLRFCSFFILLTAPLFTSIAAELPLSEYLKQVREHHGGFQAADLKTAGFAEQSREKIMLYLPSLMAKGRYLHDEKPTGSPDFMGTKTRAKSLSLGISETSPLGLRGSLTYELNSVTLEGINPVLVPLASTVEGRPTLELSQPLWRNFFGSETRAQMNLLESKALANSYAEKFRAKQVLTDAEMTYWKTLLAKRLIQLREETRNRAVTLREWSKRRVSLQLADRSDLLQAEAALKLRELELDRALNDAREMNRRFNSLRGIDTDSIEEGFETPSLKELAELQLPNRSPMRDDTKAAEFASRAGAAAAKLVYARGLPTLELSGSLALNSRESTTSDAIDRSFGTAHPTYAIALTLSTPLHFFGAHDLRAGAEKEEIASELEFKRRAFEESQEWKNLEDRFKSAQARLSLVQALEDSQKLKVLNEQERLKKGRTTTYQVLIFEEDYSSAKLNRLTSETEVLSFYAQLKTFE